MTETRTTVLDGIDVLRSNAHGLGAAVFGVAAASVGIAIVLMATGAIPVPGRIDAPPAMVAMIGAAFVMAGAMCTVHGVRGAQRKRRVRERLAEDPDRPWLADHPWDPTGTDCDRGRTIANVLIGLPLVLALLVPLNWFAFGHAAKSGWFFVAVMGALDLVFGLAVWQSIYLLIRAATYGKSRLRFDTFPAFLGDRFTGRLETRFDLGGLRTLTLTLRFIEEYHVTVGTGRNRSVRHVKESLWTDTWTLEGRELSAHAHRLPIDRRLPDPTGDAASAFVTTLAARPKCRYWELYCESDSRGIDWAASFLVPVYAPRKTANRGRVDAPARTQALIG